MLLTKLLLIKYNQMQSPLGKNIVSSCLRYNVAIDDILSVLELSGRGWGVEPPGHFSTHPPHVFLPWGQATVKNGMQKSMYFPL